MEPAIPDTFVLERTFPQPPAQVFAAFADPAKKRRWYAEGGHHDVVAFETDLKVGGAETSAYRFKPGGPFEGVILSSTGVFLDIAADQRIVIASTMSLGENPISVALVTFELEPVPEGTRLTCTHQAMFFEGSDGAELRRMGWNALLDRLGGTL